MFITKKSPLTVCHHSVYCLFILIKSIQYYIFKNLCLPRLAFAVENDFNSLRSDVYQQFETLQNKVSSQKEMLTALEENVQKVST